MGRVRCAEKTHFSPFQISCFQKDLAALTASARNGLKMNGLKKKGQKTKELNKQDLDEIQRTTGLQVAQNWPAGSGELIIL
jgi:hypothetical protein